MSNYYDRAVLKDPPMFVKMAEDSIYVGPRGNVRLWVGDFNEDGIPRLVYLLAGSMSPLEVVQYLWFRQSPDLVDAVDEKLGLTSPEVRRAWAAGRILRDVKRRGISMKEWSEISGQSAEQLRKAYRILEAMGRAAKGIGGKYYIYGPPVSVIEMAALYGK